MAKLICKLDNKVVNEYALDKERITIGRRQDNDIVVDHLAVSGLHAQIETIGRDSFLEDLDSTNGTTVNLKPVKKHILQDGDAIEIGRYQFVYDINAVDPAVQEKAAAEASTPLEDAAHTQPHTTPSPSLKSMIQMTRDSKESTANEAPKAEENTDEVTEKTAADLSATTPHEIPKATPAPKLRILNGSNAGKTLTLNKTLNTIGKPGSQMMVVTKRSNGFFVSQVEGKKSLTINQKTPATVSEKLNHQDIIEFSGIQMQFIID